MARAVGIDLGTTNSCVSVLEGGEPTVIANAEGSRTTPSIVAFAKNGEVLVGEVAKRQAVTNPDRTIRSVKREMGTKWTVDIDGKKYTPQEISARVLQKLKRDAESYLGETIADAVITVPAYFNDAQRTATKEAGEIAGLEVVRILNEPTAASLTYDAGQQDLRRMLVYDLGGGTFDVSIVQAQAGVVEVLSSHGDTQLGGDDFDDLLLKHVCDRFQAEHGIDLRANLASKARVLRAVEAAKRHLSDHPFARIEEEFIAEKEGLALHLNLEISRQEYEEMIQPLLDRTMDCLQRALTDSHLVPAQIDKVVLVGGSTR